MPDTQHPPYGISHPRLLNRWLDVNSQNGALKRTKYNIVVPAYEIAFENPNLISSYSWGDSGNGYAITIGQTLQLDWWYYFTKGNATQLYQAIDGANNLINLLADEDEFFYGTIPIIFGVPEPNQQSILVTTSNYIGADVTSKIQQVLPDIICVYKYVAGFKFSLHDYEVTHIEGIGTITISDVNGKYILNDDPLNPLYGSTPYYDKQLIQSEFRIEIWASISAAVASSRLNFLTTKKYTLDYRYGTDVDIFPTETVTEFGSIFPIVEEPIEPPIEQNVIVDPDQNVIVDPDGNPIIAL